jgi:hypothetical protein
MTEINQAQQPSVVISPVWLSAGNNQEKTLPLAKPH